MFSPFLSLVLVLLAVGALLWASAVALAAWSLLHPPRMTDGKALAVLRRMSPADLGLPFDDVDFDVRDERTGERLRLKGWWIPAARGAARASAASAAAAAGDRTVVLLHGYADAKVGAIAWAPAWRRLGFHVLALDLRAHGESGGARTTAGYFERHDVAQVTARLRADRPGQTRRLVLFGASSGAAVALAAAEVALADDPAAVDAVVLESPFADYARAAAAHMALLGLPAAGLPRAAVRLAERWAGASFAAVRPVDLVARVGCPVLVLTSDPDPYLPPADAAALRAAVASRPPGRAGPGRYRSFGDVGHLMAVVAAPEAYERALADFVREALDAPAASPATATPAAAPRP